MTHDIRQILRLAIDADASDILLSAGNMPALRVGGRLQPIEGPEVAATDVTAALDLMTSDAQRAIWQEHRHLDFGITVADRRVRGSVSWSMGRPSLALRLIPGAVPKPNELGLPQALVDALQRPWGLIIASGPAGHGKTSTIASLVDVVNRTQMQHIVTIEDPIEYVHKPVRSVVDQQEVRTDTPSFASALRQVLRHNPDVIVVGEIRDRETLEAALTIAETGHLVLTTMHANDAVQAIDRITSFFPQDRHDYICGQLAMVIAAIVNQRLVRGLQGDRKLAAELLMSSHAVSTLIREGRTAQLHSALESERGHGSCSMNFALKQLVDAGEVHIAEARRHVNRLETDPLPLVGG